MLAEMRGVTDSRRRRVDEPDPGARTHLGRQLDGERHEHAGQEFDQAGVADQLGELCPEMALVMLRVERLERAGGRPLEENEDGQEFALDAGAHGAATGVAGGKQLLPPQGLKRLPELIYRAEEFEDTHRDASPPDMTKGALARRKPWGFSPSGK